MQKRKLFALILAFTYIFAIFPAHAEDINDLQPRYTYINGLSTTFTKNSLSGKAYIYAEASMYETCSEIKLDIYLQRYSNGKYNTIESWSKTGTGTFIKNSVSSYQLDKNYLEDYRIIGKLRVVTKNGGNTDFAEVSNYGTETYIVDLQ